jgi:hypothetical protein
VGEYALITAAVASIAVSLAKIPQAELASRLPTTAAKVQALVVRDARTRRVSAADARAALARAPYRRPPLRYLYVSGWLEGRASAASCVFARAAPESGARRAAATIRRNAVLGARLARMHVTVEQAARAVVRGTADAC